MKNRNSFYILVLFNQLINSRKLIPVEVQYILPEFRIKFLLNPRQILTLDTVSLSSTFSTLFLIILKKENVCTCLKTNRQRSLIITIYDPVVRLHDLKKLSIKFLAGYCGPVRLVINLIQVIQRKARHIPQFPGKTALARPRAAYNDNTVHDNVSIIC